MRVGVGWHPSPVTSNTERLPDLNEPVTDESQRPRGPPRDVHDGVRRPSSRLPDCLRQIPWTWSRRAKAHSFNPSPARAPSEDGAVTASRHDSRVRHVGAIRAPKQVSERDRARLHGGTGRMTRRPAFHRLI
jgi:hypothetical protein